MPSVKRVLVVGCGIGGGTLAYALRRMDMNVHCIDNKPSTPTTGAGICLLHNAVRALGAIGLAERCLESGLPFQLFKQYDATGKLLVSNPAPPGCGMRRPDLARILEGAAAQAGATLDKGVTLQDLVDRGSAVDVTFSDGREGTYDIVVAADGAYSKLRERVFGTAYAPKFAGQSAWRFNVPRPSEVDGFCLYRSADGKRTIGALPTSKESCYLFFLENSAEHMHMPDDQLHVLLRERLSEFSAPTIRLSAEQLVDPAQASFRPFDITLVPAPWHRGRVVLIGDAAHSPTPQMTSGGGMAIEDAVVLAECLDAHATAPEALVAYSQRRFERVKTVFDASLQLCRYEQEPVPNPQRSAALLLQTYQYLAQPM